ncbi:MAG TPA: ATP-dependent zinc metalloprotease FtsH [Candidatus Limisoma intestinavium]|uniref:ATP-dependent zinc metalloprotease FtsH n=1 Tax=Candidatus Limisoma intestinavium TaxID=2840856 RepID=A0A9D1LGR4_9BACT|nr:ATP-dependent zinc metalloprotease FtsH [Candidatus Limisoma intestinavium]
MDNKNKKQFGFKFNIFWMYAIIGIALFSLFYMQDTSVERKVNWQPEFTSYLELNGVTSIVAYPEDNEIEATLTDSLAREVFKGQQSVDLKKAKIIVKVPADALKEKLEEVGYKKGLEYAQGGSLISSFLWAFGPIVLLIVFWFILMRRMSRGGGDGSGGVFSVGKSKAQLFDKEKGTNVTFKDVAGLQEAKTEIEEIVEFLKNPRRYTDLGGKIPKGALLVGPPGTGKTLLAKAVAGEANVPFFSLSGSDFVEMFVGVGASRVRDLFKKAKDKAPCIIFIDEIDAVGRARGRNPNLGANDERENTLNQLLTEMDGFGTNSGIIVLAATNRVDILDKALLRAGRFDRQIYVDLPDLNDRKEIFYVHLRNVKIADDVDVDLLARQTPGFSGADIANVCNEAALIAARRNKVSVEKQDFMDAVDRIVGGLEKRSKITTEEERESIATHEAGHATISWHLKYANPLIKVTIVPRGKALGAAWYLPEERQIVPEQAMLDEICSLLGGRAAEEMFIGHISTGALNDLERATKQAYAIVAYYGMSKELPNVSYYDSSGQDYMFSKPYSEDRARMIDSEVTRILTEQYERAKQILMEHETGHHKLRDLLLTREVIYTEDVEHIFGKRKWASRADEIIKANEALEEERKKNESQTSGEDAPAESKPSTDVPATDEAADGATPPPVPDKYKNDN